MKNAVYILLQREHIKSGSRSQSFSSRGSVARAQYILNISECVYNEVVSLLAHMDDQDKGKIALRIAFIAETKLAIVLTVLLEKLQKDEQNRIDIYCVLEKVLQQDTQGLERQLLKKIITLASNHMTDKTQEARNELKVAASNTLVTLARCYFSDVMLELVYHLELPEEFIFITLGNLSSAYALKCIPFVGMILKVMISMLALVKDSRMRQAFCGVLEKWSRAVNVYFRNWEKCPFPRMGESQFCKNILPLYCHVTSNWLSCEELQLKQAVIKALGPMMGILLHKKEPQNPIFKEISWLLEQYKEEIDVFHVTKVVSEYFPSEQATDFIEATLGGLLSASPTCVTAAGLWMKIILKECGGAMLDKVPDILAILYRHMPTIQEGSLRQFLVEAVSILAHHHQEAVISSLLSKRLPMDRLSIKALESLLFKGGNERLVRALRKQRTWILLENPKTHHEGVCLLVSLLLRSGLITPEIIQSLLPWVNSPTENQLVTSTAFLPQLGGRLFLGRFSIGNGLRGLFGLAFEKPQQGASLIILELPLG
ncbi:unnamed protein product [Lepidochelys kempii]